MCDRETHFYNGHNAFAMDLIELVLVWPLEVNRTSIGILVGNIAIQNEKSVWRLGHKESFKDVSMV